MSGKLWMASAWPEWIEPWYLEYASLGVSVAGLVPILLLLMVHTAGGATHVGLEVAAFNRGGLSALGILLLCHIETRSALPREQDLSQLAHRLSQL